MKIFSFYNRIPLIWRNLGGFVLGCVCGDWEPPPAVPMSVRSMRSIRDVTASLCVLPLWTALTMPLPLHARSCNN